MRTKIFEIPGKLLCEFDSEAKVVIDTWTTYDISLEDFKEAVLIKGVNYGKANGVVAWIVDSHNAIGAFSEEIQAFIGTDIFPTFAKIGVKYFMTINSGSIVTNKNIAQYSAQVGPNGMQLITGYSAEGAIEWIMKNG